jgi:DNA-binding beta-propeller fold protein YncE
MGGVVPGVAADSQGRVFVGRRHPPALLVYDRDGVYIDTWGADLLGNPHLLWVDGEDQVYAADTDDHTIRCFNPQGEVVHTWGTPGVPGAPDQPFNQPTKAMRGPSGDLYVADGYGQYRIHRISDAGELVHSWGSAGTGPGQFALPHSLWVDRDERVWAVDRENNRIQRFDSEGCYLDEWTDLVMPMDLFITPDNTVYIVEAPSRVSIFDIEGQLLARWGEDGSAPGQFADAPHSIWVDEEGSLYIGEVATLHDRVQKFRRV